MATPFIASALLGAALWLIVAKRSQRATARVAASTSLDNAKAERTLPKEEKQAADGTVWAEDEEVALIKAAEKFPASDFDDGEDDRMARFAAVASELAGSQKSAQQCADYFDELASATKALTAPERRAQEQSWNDARKTSAAKEASFRVQKQQRADHAGAEAKLEAAKSRVLRLWCTMLVLFYVPLVSTSSSAFVCSAPSGGKSLLMKDTSVDCASPEHTVAQIVAGLVLVVFGLGFPVGLAVLLRRLRATERLHAPGSLAA